MGLFSLINLLTNRLMYETYDGVITHKDEHFVYALYEVDNQPLEQRYEHKQFITLPEVGDKIAVSVSVCKKY